MKLKVSVDANEDLPGIINSSGERVLDDWTETFTLELTGTNEKVDSFIERVADCAEILAVVRSGAMAIARGHNVLSAQP